MTEDEGAEAKRLRIEWAIFVHMMSITKHQLAKYTIRMGKIGTTVHQVLDVKPLTCMHGGRAITAHDMVR